MKNELKKQLNLCDNIYYVGVLRVCVCKLLCVINLHLCQDVIVRFIFESEIKKHTHTVSHTHSVTHTRAHNQQTLSCIENSGI